MERGSKTGGRGHGELVLRQEGPSVTAVSDTEAMDSGWLSSSSDSDQIFSAEEGGGDGESGEVVGERRGRRRQEQRSRKRGGRSHANALRARRLDSRNGLHGEENAGRESRRGAQGLRPGGGGGGR